MKVTKLTIVNIGIIAKESIELNKPLILFYGEIRQGKSTILNCVHWVCGGVFPQDIIRHGAQEASITLEFTGGSITRSWYRAKDGSTKAREINFIRDGKQVKSPASEIKKFLNPFLLDQDFLRNKSELERRQYFVELFGIDSSAEDAELAKVQRDATDLRAKIKGYGNIDLTPYERVDVDELHGKLSEIKSEYQSQLSDAYSAELEVGRHNEAIRETQALIEAHRQEITNLELALARARDELALREEWLRSNPYRDTSGLPIAPDTSHIEQQISEALATNVRAEQFENNKARNLARASDEESLLSLEHRAREIRDAKIAKLKGISESCGVPGLAFDEEGNFIYEGTTAGMISDSQIMRLSSELSQLYPNGFGLDLIDRGESLGKSIFEFVDRAKAEEKTILATIVGERPATVPEDIGVFVVKAGMISPN